MAVDTDKPPESLGRFVAGLGATFAAGNVVTGHHLGTWLVVEPCAGDEVAGNLNPAGRVYYNASSQLCVPNAPSQPGGYAPGAQAGQAAIRQVSAAAGFARFRRTAETPFNLVYEVRPQALPNVRHRRLTQFLLADPEIDRPRRCPGPRSGSSRNARTPRRNISIPASPPASARCPAPTRQRYGLRPDEHPSRIAGATFDVLADCPPPRPTSRWAR